MSPLPRLLAVALPLLLLGCGGSTDGTPAPKGPRVETAALFSGGTPMVYTVKPEWHPGGAVIAFEGGTTGLGGWDVFAVAASSGAAPSKVTNWTDALWEDGGKTPASLGDGTLVYWSGSRAGDNLHHLMAAAPGQSANVPAPTVLHTFTPAALGQTGVGSPETLTLSSDGLKAVLSWGADTWLLDWTGGPTPVATSIPGVSQCVISREGTHLAYRKTTGEIAVRPLAGGAETVLGPGTDPSWASGGRLGFLGGGGYTVVTVGTGASLTYATGGALLQLPVLSWDATKIAFRTFGGANTGLSVGALVQP